MSFHRQTGALVMCSLTGCQVGGSATSGRFADMEPPPEYGVQMRRLFDDEIGAIALGNVLQMSGENSTSLLSSRALAAQNIVVCQVGTITEGSAGETTYAIIDFKGPGVSLTRTTQDDCPSISVSSKSHGFSTIHQSSSALVGKSIVIFLKRFNEFGRQILHWHAEFDGPLIRDEVKRIGTSIQ